MVQLKAQFFRDSSKLKVQNVQLEGENYREVSQRNYENIHLTEISDFFLKQRRQPINAEMKSGKVICGDETLLRIRP